MVDATPSPIKDYYIAYFDILGYKDFFQQQPEKVPELLGAIHDAIRRTNEHIGLANQSPIMSGIGGINIKIKIFSDNILLCLEVSNEPIEQMRLLLFMQIVAEIQRGFVVQYGLFVRGGICKGELSFNDDYVFGQGLINAVSIEEKAQFPRIIVEPELITFLRQNLFYTQEEYKKAVQIEKAASEGTDILPEDKNFYSQILQYSQILKLFQQVAQHLTLQWPDEEWIISYLDMVDSSTLFSQEVKESFVHQLETVSPYDYQLVSQPLQNLDEIIKAHKSRVIAELKKYGKNVDIATGDTKAAEVREHILKKYIWIMAYHNQICVKYQKMNHFISTTCNCDKRFMKMTIEVLDDETGV